MNKMAKKNNCKTHLILLILSILILLGSIPLYVVGINNMNKKVEKNIKQLQLNTEEIIALVMSSVGMLGAVFFGLTYATCKK